MEYCLRHHSKREREQKRNLISYFEMGETDSRVIDVGSLSGKH